MGNNIHSTDLRLKISVTKSYTTVLETVNRTLNNFATDLRTKIVVPDCFGTDLRITPTPYDSIAPKALNNLIVKKDGIELEDVDYNTLRITFNLNNIPSSAVFNLARYHDKLDFTLDAEYSQITAENKIQIYDGSILLFTGYIEQIVADSNEEIVTITAEDVRAKIKKRSLKLSYGGKAITKESTDILDEYSDLPTDPADGDAYIVKHDNHLYIRLNSVWSDRGNIDTLNWSNQRFKVSTKTALETVFSYITDLISGYDTVDFGFIPEYNNEYSDCAALIDTLIQNSANINWYVDENEYIRFQKISNGTIKTLRLSSLTEQRNIYDVVIDTITLNKKSLEYVSAYEIRFGKHIKQTWFRSSDHPNLNELPTNYVRELTWFGFQKSNTNSLYGTNLIYVGEGVTSISGYENEYFYIVGYFVYQWLSLDETKEIPSVLIGSGYPRKTVYYTSYGIQESNTRWEERTLENGDVYLYAIKEEQIDNTDFAVDAALFDLSQNNVEKTEANITLILDSYEYYSLGLKDLVNLSNTLILNTYNNQNGFPLNIQSVTIDGSTRLVTLSLTNYGKSYAQRSGDILLNYSAKSERKLYLKHQAINPESGV